MFRSLDKSNLVSFRPKNILVEQEKTGLELVK